MKLDFSEPQDLGQSMSAMTDVIFQLLIFFLVTMSGYAEMALLEAGLPGSGAAVSEAALAEVMRVRINDNDSGMSVTVNGNIFTQDEFVALLKRYSRLQPDVEILVSCAPDSLHSDLVFVLSECSRQGLKNLKMVR